MGEKSIYGLFETAVKKWQRITGNPLNECKLKVLSQFTIEAKHCLDEWVVERKEFSDYSLMYHLGLADNTYFYRENQVLGALDIGDFYRKIEVKDNALVCVRRIEDFRDWEIEKVLEALGKAISRGGVRKMIVPPDFFVFEVQVLSSKEEPKKDREGRVRNFIFKQNTPDEAINKLKEALIGITENYFKNFRVFYNNRWRIMKTKLNEGWLAKGYVSIANFKVIS